MPGPMNAVQCRQESALGWGKSAEPQSGKHVFPMGHVAAPEAGSKL